MKREEKRSMIASIPVILGRNIKSQRRYKGLTQHDLGKICGLSRTSIINIEKGVQQPSIQNLYSISLALEVTVSGLLPVSLTNERPC